MCDRCPAVSLLPRAALGKGSVKSVTSPRRPRKNWHSVHRSKMQAKCSASPSVAVAGRVSFGTHLQSAEEAREALVQENAPEPDAARTHELRT